MITGGNHGNTRSDRCSYEWKVRDVIAVIYYGDDQTWKDVHIFGMEHAAKIEAVIREYPGEREVACHEWSELQQMPEPPEIATAADYGIPGKGYIILVEGAPPSS